MKKFLLFAGLTAMATSLSAENHVYFFKDQSGQFDQMGAVYGLSRNGEYAVIFDEEMDDSFLWKLSEPDKLIYLNEFRNDKKVRTEVRGVNNDGTIVGSVGNGNQWLPFVKELDGEMVSLPMPEKALNLNYPCFIDDTGNIIGGQLGGSCTRPGEDKSFGQNQPVYWVKGDDGEFELKYNQDLEMPKHQGVTPRAMFSDGTLENTWMGGTIAAGAMSYLPFLYRGTGELIMWNECTGKMVDFYYKGKLHSTSYEELIDGLRDGFDQNNGWPEINASFSNADWSGNFYGTLPVVYDQSPVTDVKNPEDQNEFGKAKVRYERGWFNVLTNKWTASESNPSIQVGLDGKVLFSGNYVYPDGLESNPQGLTNYLGVNISAPGTLMGVNRISGSGNVLAMGYVATDAVGVEHMYPFMVTLDRDLVSIDNITIDPANEVAIFNYDGTIEVVGATEVAVYDMNGIQVSAKATSNVAAGTYIVVADGVSHKILVK